MRTIKFRGKSPCFNTWLYGDLVRANNTVCICEKGSMEMDGHHIRQFADRPQYVDERTVGQFTGLYDCNGSEIYEGDILELKIMLYGKQEGKSRIRRAIWKNSGFYLVDKWNDCVCEAPTTTHDLVYTIIGNIYDNPELLESKTTKEE